MRWRSGAQSSIAVAVDVPARRAGGPAATADLVDRHHVVHVQAEADHPVRPLAVEGGDDQRQRLDQVRRQRDHQLALQQRLPDQAEVEVLQVAQARRARAWTTATRCPTRSPPARRSATEYPRVAASSATPAPGDPAADDDDVEGLVGHGLQGVGAARACRRRYRRADDLPMQRSTCCASTSPPRPWSRPRAPSSSPTEPPPRDELHALITAGWDAFAAEIGQTRLKAVGAAPEPGIDLLDHGRGGRSHHRRHRRRGRRQGRHGPRARGRRRDRVLGRRPARRDARGAAGRHARRLPAHADRRLRVRRGRHPARGLADRRSTAWTSPRTPSRS